MFLGGCCQCLCLCSFQTSLEMKDVLLLTTPPPPPPNSLHPLLLYLPLPSSLPDFSFTALIHFSQLFQALFKVIIVSGGSGSHFLWCCLPTFHSVTLQRCTGRTALGAHPSCRAHFYQKPPLCGRLHGKQASENTAGARSPQGTRTSRQFCSSFIHLATLLSQRVEQILNKDQ